MGEPAERFEWRLRLRLTNGQEQVIPSFNTRRRRDLGDIVNLPIDASGSGEPGQGHLWRVKKIGDEGTLVLDYVRPNRGPEG